MTWISDWRAEHREKLLTDAIVAVDCAAGEAEENDDLRYKAHCGQIMEFLEAERGARPEGFKAGRCADGSATDNPCPRPPTHHWHTSVWLCERHYTVAVLADKADSHHYALDALEGMLYEAKGDGCEVLEDALMRAKASLQGKLSELEGLLGAAKKVADPPGRASQQ